MTPDHDEILRIRERLHKLAADVGAINYRQQDGDRWRRGVDRQIARLQRKVDSMSHADEIASKVTEALQAQRAGNFSTLQKVVGAIVAIIALAPSIHLIAGWF